MTNYQKKQVHYEMHQVTKETVRDVVKWCNGREVREYDALDSNKEYVGVNVLTFQGNQRASEGDWVARNQYGEWSVVRANDFVDVFEPVRE